MDWFGILVIGLASFIVLIPFRKRKDERRSR